MSQHALAQQLSPNSPSYPAHFYLLFSKVLNLHTENDDWKSENSNVTMKLKMNWRIKQITPRKYLDIFFKIERGKMKGGCQLQKLYIMPRELFACHIFLSIRYYHPRKTSQVAWMSCRLFFLAGPNKEETGVKLCNPFLPLLSWNQHTLLTAKSPYICIYIM